METKDDRPRIKEEILTRVKCLYVAFFCAGLFMTGRIAYVMFFSREISDNADRLQKRIFLNWEIPAMRGSILSRDGEPLATSMFRYQAEMDFSSRGLDSLELFAEQADSLAKRLSLFFRDRTAAQYRDFLISKHSEHYRTVNRRDTQILRSGGWLGRIVDRLRGREFVTRPVCDTIRDSTLVPILPRRVDYYEWQELSTYPILNRNLGVCYRLDEQDQRIYPQGGLALRTIGKSDDRGRNFGIEEVCREQLAGVPGRAHRQRIARGFYGRTAGGDVAPVDGADVVTTIDLDLQDVADKALRRQLARQNAIWGTAIVMEVETGDILAMANLGRTPGGDYAENRNYALGARMEPGSTFKLAALLALTEDAGKELSLEYDSGDGRVVQVGNAKVQDSHPGFSVVDLKTATAQSLNVYYAKAIFAEYRENPKRYTDFLASLHLDRPMGLEAYGEAEPVFPTPGSKIWYKDMTLPNMGYGYGIELAPIQTITLYNAVANGGRMVAPRLVRALRRGRETVEEYAPVTLVRSICSDEALRKVRECLEEVARSGTAKYYFGDTTRYRVAAKTGTAKVAQGSIRYSDGYYLGSMAVYLPAEKPRYTVMTAIYTRRGNGTTYYGAGLAGPVEKQIADYLYNREHEWHGRLESGGKRRPRSIKGGDVAQIRRVADRLSPRTSFESRSGWGRAAVDSMSNVSISNLETEPGTVPDVRGMGLKEALFLLENAGLRVSFRGKGAVAAQSLSPGSRCRAGERIEITLKQI